MTGFEKFTYGKFITRMRAPDKKGTVSSFFTYWNGPNFYPGGWNELDIEIVPSVEQNPFSMNVIYGDGEKKRETHDYKPNFDPKNEWHIYEMAWTPDYIAWSIDNKEVRRINKDDPSVKFTSKPQSVMMNFWTPTFDSWGKGLDASDMPWEVEYDYVETYTYNHDTKGFDFNWRDNFNTFDTNRWHKSDNTTFDANSTIFRASQAFINEGNLVLKMEPDHPENVHGEARFTHPSVSPVMTEPTPEHHSLKGGKGKEADEHFDVGAEQHYSRIEDEQRMHAERYGMRPYAYGYGPYPYGPNPYGYEYARHADPYAAEFYHGQHYNPYYFHESAQRSGHKHEPLFPEDPYHYNPYHHPKPPQTKGQAEKHMGPEASLFYREMHGKQEQGKDQKSQQQGGKSQQGKENFAMDYHLLDEETPFEH